jgi:glycosyltransferase involved in cell wall biosynthesis
MNIGGIGNYILTLSAALKDKGAEVIVASGGGNLEDELKKLGIGHTRINIITKSEISPKVLMSGFALRGIIKRENIDVIHAHTRVSQVAASLASLMTGVPFVTTCHGYFKTRLRKVLDTWGRRVIAISDAVKEHLVRDLGVSEDRVELIYSGVDVERFSGDCPTDETDTIKRSLGLRPTPVVGNIGRLSPVKGHKYLVEAMAGVIKKLPEAQALIIGDGDEKEALEKLASGLGIRDSVRFVSSVIDTPRMLSIMDIFVFPSIKEGLGIALLEALAAGRACVASKVGGIENIIKDGSSGLLVEAGDSAGFARAVVLLLEDAERRGRMGERGRNLVREKFTLDMMADKVIGLYEDIVMSNE